jgi:hypothetical protein
MMNDMLSVILKPSVCVGPFPERSRIWHDRSGRFCVEATLLGFNNGKLKLRKLNGVIVAVHSEKMSVQDLQYVEEMTSKAAVEPSSSSSSGHTATDNDGWLPCPESSSPYDSIY